MVIFDPLFTVMGLVYTLVLALLSVKCDFLKKTIRFSRGRPQKHDF